MTTWLKGDNFPFKAESRSICEYRGGQIWIAGAREGATVYYSVRTWRDGATYWSAPRVVFFVDTPATVQVFISEKDGLVQLQCGEQNWYIRPEDIDEIKPEPPPPAPDPIPDLDGHWLSVFEYVLWKGKDALEVVRETIREARQHRVGRADFFLYISDSEHWHVNKKTPWVYRTGKFDLDQKNQEFFDLFEGLLQVGKDEGFKLMAQLFMAGGYCMMPWQNNHQGLVIREIHDPAAWEYQFKLAEWVCESYKKVGMTPEIKLANEIAHNGDAQKFHDIGRWHRAMWDRVLSKYMALNDYVLDISHSEAPALDMVGDRFPCPKPGPTCYSPDGWHGDNSKGREVWLEHHGMSTIEDFTVVPPGYDYSYSDFVFGSNNQHWRPTEDGASWTGTGKGLNVNGFKFPTAEQSYEAAKYVWGRAKERNNTLRMRVRWGWFPVETLQQPGLLPDYHKDKIDWTRPAALRRAWEEVYK